MESGLVESCTVTSSKIKGGGDRDRLETDLGTLPGVRDVIVDTDAHTVEVTYDPREVSVSNIKSTLEADGYKVESESAGTPMGAANTPQNQ